MSDLNDVSLASSDVLHQIDTHIAKPPNYGDGESAEEEEEEDQKGTIDISTKTTRETEGRDETDGVGEDDNGKKAMPPTTYNVCDDDSDTTRRADKGVDGSPNFGCEMSGEDSDEKVNRAVHEKVDEEEEATGKGAGGGQKQTGGSWVLVQRDGETAKDDHAEDSSVDNIPALVDGVETAMEEMTKGDPGAFSRLISFLMTLLPQILFLVDELKTLKAKMRGLIMRNRHLEREVRRMEEAEKRRQVEKVSIGTTALIQPEAPSTKCMVCEKRKESEVTEDTPLASETDWKKEARRLKCQCRELQRVNHSWEKYTTKISMRHEAEMRKKDGQLAATEERCKILEKRMERKFKEYDQTLFHLKSMESQQKNVAERYRKERDHFRQKTELLTVQLGDREDEIKRLNAVVERKNAQKAVQESGIKQQARLVDQPRPGSPSRELVLEEKRRSAAPPAGHAQHCPEGRREEALSKRASGKVSSPPLSPRGPPEQVKEAPLSFTRSELKDQVLLYREQMDVYRSDFHQERRDREKAVGQVDSLKKELEKTKTKLKDLQTRRKVEAHNLYVLARQQGRGEIFPEEAQEMRLREIQQSARGGQKYPAYGRKQVEDNDYLLEGHLYEELY
ncbi:uncharacterized protein [Diadema setosum]|uniref:uncharacterized protein n=1 Tax=Diadema setosum TaxID=31175 RepID=UPI003B3BB6E2